MTLTGSRGVGWRENLVVDSMIYLANVVVSIDCSDVIRVS